MKTLKRIKKNSTYFWTIFLILISFILILSAGKYYIDSLRKDLMNQAVSNVLTVTQQQQQAFDTFISGDRERTHSYATYFSRIDSRNTIQIREQLNAFSEVNAFYTVVNLSTGVYCSNQSFEILQLSETDLADYRALSGSGVRNPYIGLYSNNLMFGYYETFTFADGTPGLFQKSYDCSKVSQDFSLSFYNGEGFGFVVTREGDILLRSVDRNDRFPFDNIFDIIVNSSQNQANLDSFMQALDAQETGSTVFSSGAGEYIYTYVPVSNVDNWYLISIVPMTAVMREANETITNSQSMLLIFFAIMIVFLIFFLCIWRIQKNLKQKDMEIEYRSRQFEIFSTYLSNNTNDIYMMLNADDLRVEYISPNVERVLGIPEDEAMRDVTTFGRAEYVSDETIELADLNRMRPGDSMNTMMTRRENPKTGEQKWFEETVYCVELQNERKIVVYISDRTKERQTQDTLSQALDMAQVANKAKSNFLGSVSHDIRTPMNAIMGLVMLLREEANDPERVLEYTQRIDAASQHLLGLINDVLDMNKIEGGITLNISEITLPEIIDELNTIIRPQTRAKHQSFKIFATSFSNEHLLGDKLRINQILINILSNAVKYTPAGGDIELSVSELPPLLTDYSRIRFVVRDNGQGMSEDYLNTIFEPFTREQNDMTSSIQGTGLGMAITKSLIDLMGGTIFVESEVGKGSTFTIELDLRVQNKAMDSEFWKTCGVHRMIVADDDENVCRNVVKAMEQTGVIVHYATSGQDAIRTMRIARESGEPYDLILLDWKMPDLDGLETARLIRKNYPTKIPILFFTAYDWRDIEAEAMEIGVDHFLPKPFFLHSFQDAITRVMSGGQKPASQLDKAHSVVKGMHILVVDDVEVNRMILVKILNSLGATSEIAENGRVAADKFLSTAPGTFDLILMDVQMPMMDGYTATRQIRASLHAEAKTVPIIAMTANAFVDDVRDALASGMDAHVSKPIVLEQLKSTIQEVLARKGR